MADNAPPTQTRPSPRLTKTTPGSRLLQTRTGATPIPPSLAAKMAAMTNRGQRPPVDPLQARSSPVPPIVPVLPKPGSAGLANRRKGPGLKLPGMDEPFGGGALGAGLGAGAPSLAPNDPPIRRPNVAGSPFDNFGKIVDPSGRLNFGGKAVLHASGVDFSNGQSFAINMDQLELYEDLGKGNYGTVKKVLHRPTKVAMAMKEIRLELDQAKLNAIIMELDILHRAVTPEIVEFYGAFFIESCVYYCMEYMDAGSMDKLQVAGVPEDVLARVLGAVVRGLKFLKDDLQIMHRDVKPTNILINRKGAIKLCDFGVSGQLEKSLARTNIGCQSYMAPERIRGESVGSLGAYTVSSDVWSVGLSAIEMALGHYPYPPETYSNVFAQLTAIVHGPPPELPEGNYSENARNWVERCLEKVADRRATYAELMAHPWMVEDREREVDMVGWVAYAIEQRNLKSQPSEEAPPPPEEAETRVDS